MPSAFTRLFDQHKKSKTLKSASDSETFDADGTIHVDGLVGSATISPSGRDVALASPEGLTIIDLDSPYSPPRRLSSHGSPWLVVDVQWSPFADRDYWVASTANHRCLVWNLNLRDDSPSGAIEHSLQGHSRAITDINFSAHSRDFLATCAVDGYVHCWDLRRPRQPALTFCDWFAGATQVKYNRQDSHILASSHDRYLHIWDDRNAAEPLRTISAHTSKIYGLDWNRTRATGVVTCSLDKSIKFWDYGNEGDEPERVIRTDFPVWRARHAPFGWGLLAMPQNEPGNLYLYDRRSESNTPKDGHVDPVAVFPGHGNHKVKEFLWRSRGTVTEEADDREFQLVSWGEDNELRLQRPDPEDLAAVGFVKGGPPRKRLNITRKGAVYKTFRTVDDHPHRDRRTATMSDPRPATSGTGYRRSALTMSMQAPHYPSRSAWRGPSMKAKPVSSQEADRSHAQIGWMKGVSMNKRKSSSDTPQRQDSKDSSMLSPGYPDDDWGEPESIHEEFVRISNQLPNVKWENIDMDNLTLNASLKGPWGEGGETIFIKVRVDIPASYPKLKAPRFFVEQSSFMPDETHQKIETELQELTAQFLQRKKNCLDVAFTYLLGEVDLEASTTFFKNVRDFDDVSDDLADESSSEDDETEIPAGGSASMSQELTLSTEDNTLAPSFRPMVVPPKARTCGARFSNDGRIVCFFPTKDQRAKDRFALAADANRDRLKGEPNFAGFGRLTHDSPPLKQRNEDEDASATSDHSDGSDDSDASSSSSSSDSELTTMHKISLWYQAGRRIRKTWSANDSIRSSGGGTGAGTGTGTGTSRRRPGKPKSITSIHDYRVELPSKQQFAQEYAIFGDGAEVCEHNAKVAEKYGYPDLVDIWRYSALLLRSDIPLKLTEQSLRRKSVLVIARDAVSRFREDDRGSKGDDELLTGRVKWGYHPLAQEFIHDLFDYFDQLADIQMLAMLSCIFGDSSAEDSVAYAESHLTQPETPLPMKAPSFSLEYFPTNPDVWNMHARSAMSSAVTTPRTAHTPILYSGSQGSEEVSWAGEPASNSYSCGETPPMRFGRDHLLERDQTQSLSTSPNTRSFRRTNSALTSTITASLPRTLSGIISSSPPEPPVRKRPSPAETILSNLAPSNITWGGSTVFGAQAENPGTARTSLSDDDYRREEMLSMVAVDVTVHTENSRLFNDDGWMATPFLEPSHNAIYAGYRYAYAEMLQMWGQPLARLEIMKFNVLKDDSMTASGVFGDDASAHESFGGAESVHSHNHSISSAPPQTTPGTTSPTLVLGNKKEQLQALLASDRGLDVTGLCSRCEMQLEPLEYTTEEHDGAVGGAVGTCHRCHRAQAQLRCVYCTEPVDALYPPCLGCGCVAHEHCLAEWHAMGETDCPAGDECRCVDEADCGQIESWTAMRAQMAIDAAALRVRDDNVMRPPHLRAGGVGLLGRTRRRSVPAGVGFHDEEEEDDAGYDSPSGGSLYSGEDGRNNWEGVSSAAHHLLAAGARGSGGVGRPSPLGAGQLSAARENLAARLRPSALRRRSGNVLQRKN
ncbi:uncharacterized protein E0L32_008366 [Thyridium curvatum]|uniref:WDR59/RTC1-like RING zinc finger domain-containing protein n=1 Tax=Thyridium curvatum TaxID=1093900 RepID=A0A507ALM7_9PEZI|nr:uncharacterized protein E0L32_008366 [Thyridium curvatum]TPX10632.1 hypothetical protein E0L32_008366 [Thyridium curvatum]